MERESILKTKSFQFAVRIINLYKFLKSNYKEYAISMQLLKSGTAIGALVREAEHAESKKDFTHKLSISLKEVNETIYWIQLLYVTKFLSKRMYESIQQDATELLKILIASIKTSKRKLNSQIEKKFQN